MKTIFESGNHIMEVMPLSFGGVIVNLYQVNVKKMYDDVVCIDTIFESTDFDAAYNRFQELTK